VQASGCAVPTHVLLLDTCWERGCVHAAACACSCVCMHTTVPNSVHACSCVCDVLALNCSRQPVSAMHPDKPCQYPLAGIRCCLAPQVHWHPSCRPAPQVPLADSPARALVARDPLPLPTGHPLGSAAAAAGQLPPHRHPHACHEAHAHGAASPQDGSLQWAGQVGGWQGTTARQATAPSHYPACTRGRRHPSKCRHHTSTTCATYKQSPLPRCSHRLQPPARPHLHNHGLRCLPAVLLEPTTATNGGPPSPPTSRCHHYWHHR